MPGPVPVTGQPVPCGTPPKHWGPFYIVYPPGSNAHATAAASCAFRRGLPPAIRARLVDHCRFVIVRYIRSNKRKAAKRNPPAILTGRPETLRRMPAKFLEMSTSSIPLQLYCKIDLDCRWARPLHAEAPADRLLKTVK
jgi:hypothetical protein